MRIAALAAALVVLVVGTAAGARSNGKASLRIVSSAPVTVAGVRFKPLERVRLRVAVSGTRLVRRARASRRGRFVVAVPYSLDRCSEGLVVRAVGAHGSRALLKLPPMLCPPRLDPAP